MGLIHERWLDTIVRPAGVALLFGCLIQGVVGALELIVPNVQIGYLVPLCVLVAFEAHYSYWFVRRRSRVLDAIWKYRLIELGLLYFVVQACSQVAEGHPLSALGAVSFDQQRLFGFLVVYLTWFTATETAGDIWDIGEPPIHDWRYIPPADRLVKRFFFGGAVLLAATGLTKLGLQGVKNVNHAPVSGLVLTVLIYFVVGVVMLGQIRYTALRQRWQLNGNVIGTSFSSRWLRYSLGFAVLAAAIVAFLPTSYTTGLLDTLRAVLDGITGVMQILFFVVLLPFGWVLSHLPGHMRAIHPHVVQPPPASPHAASHGHTDWGGLLRSLLFWVVALGTIVYLVRTYMQAHPRLAHTVGWWTVIRRLVSEWWRSLRRKLDAYMTAVAERMPRPGRRAAEAVAVRRSRFRFGRMTPRERVLYYYLSTVERATGRGIARRESETPGEYGLELGRRVPAIEPEMEGLTEAFVEARYAPRDVSPPMAGEARTRWQRVKAALQRVRREQGKA